MLYVPTVSISSTILKGRTIFKQLRYILYLSYTYIPVLKALEDSALAGHKKFPAAATKWPEKYTMLIKIYIMHKNDLQFTSMSIFPNFFTADLTAFSTVSYCIK